MGVDVDVLASVSELPISTVLHCAVFLLVVAAPTAVPEPPRIQTIAWLKAKHSSRYSGEYGDGERRRSRRRSSAQTSSCITRDETRYHKKEDRGSVAQRSPRQRDRRRQYGVEYSGRVQAETCTPRQIHIIPVTTLYQRILPHEFHMGDRY